MARQVLGRGLESLIPTKTKTSIPETGVSADVPVSIIPLSKIEPNPHQPRQHFPDAELVQLSESIRKHGVLQPVIVTKIDGGFELIAGERRVKASRRAGLVNIPAVVKEATDQDKLELAIIENVQRHDLNPVEEAKAYEKLVDNFKLTQEGVAMRMGKSRETIANTLRVLELPMNIQESLAEGKITLGHAKALLSVKSRSEQKKLFDNILAGGLTVRETEGRAKQKRFKPGRRGQQDPLLVDLENRLRTGLGAKVKIKPRGKGGSIQIDCFSREELSDVVRRIAGS